MFSDPQSVTYATVAKSLAKIDIGEYRLNDSGVVYDLVINHQFKNRSRFVVRLRRDAFASDPLVPTQNVLASMTATFTLDVPTTGLAPADFQNLGNALVGWLTSANILKLVNGET